mmetsp:Transcript_14245/g.24413  ORF Transcript_14245/g.24413 Transcript_14245/m.24413 type:complete len:282 (+) Transcript_14245:488-1333(+)|eukprot:CAMPEP_0184700264 /NCGR_PEP_ID=MMETSP0313-20130426/11056_1 /TAXON_ID=2792 /ORGANISM="Porphyridium aerugineum, Strain SAG 1380-2" /LENGTH=281 /DNA_ID=CAMNT_0027159837 /DNA_START=447 /DNA_END=1292 /DNA_ORIENTATION=+
MSEPSNESTLPSTSITDQLATQQIEDSGSYRFSVAGDDTDSVITQDLQDSNREVDASYEPRTVEQKVEAATKYKLVGNDLVKQQKYEEAKKEYDNAFVNIFCSKDEWALMTEQQKDYINQFKGPLHLNRALCRIKQRDWANALWDCDEGLRIVPTHIQGLYRRGVVYMNMAKDEMHKESTGEFWDVDKAENYAHMARADFKLAHSLVPKGDKLIYDALVELNEVDENLRVCKREYHKQQKSLFSKLITNLDKDNQNEAVKEGFFKDMPALEPFTVPKTLSM